MAYLDDGGGAEARPEPGQEQLEIVAYIGEFKIVGTGHFGVAHRAGSRRASDYLRQAGEGHLTLSNVSIYSTSDREIVDTAPFVVINMDRVDFVYAREEGAPSPS